MPKCPYCNKEISIEDFFEVITKETKKGKIKKKVSGFKGEMIKSSAWGGHKMWVCPSCDAILGFSEYAVGS